MVVSLEAVDHPQPTRRITGEVLVVVLSIVEFLNFSFQNLLGKNTYHGGTDKSQAREIAK
jgi:hypothetical protein